MFCQLELLSLFIQFCSLPDTQAKEIQSRPKAILVQFRGLIFIEIAPIFHFAFSQLLVKH